MEQEAFVYLWYDAPNKKYYLGKHKGTPDDSYTHSSTIWESFTKDAIPEGVSRRILAYGTHEEMCVLEHEVLVNRKKRCWDRYYNNSLGDPRYVDQSGENNPSWKGGITYDMEAYKKAYYEYMREYYQTPEYKEYKKEYYLRNKEKYKAHGKEYRLRNKEEISAKDKEYRLRNKEWYKAYMKEYRLRNKEKSKEYMREYRFRKKAERQAESIE